MVVNCRLRSKTGRRWRSECSLEPFQDMHGEQLVMRRPSRIPCKEMVWSLGSDVQDAPSFHCDKKGSGGGCCIH